MPDTSRARVLIALESGQSAQTIEQLVEATGLHPNTVRAQLEILVATGAVRRETLPPAGRGRPRNGYRRIDDVSPYRNLAEALTGQLLDLADETSISETAERWARLAGSPHEVQAPDDAVNLVVDELEGLGFEAQSGPLGDSIVLRSCPYADLAAQNGLICDIHAALITKLLDATGQGVTMRSLEVEPRPGTCVVRLDRPDLLPQRVIESASPTPAGNEGH